MGGPEAPGNHAGDAGGRAGETIQAIVDQPPCVRCAAGGPEAVTAWLLGASKTGI